MALLAGCSEDRRAWTQVPMTRRALLREGRRAAASHARRTGRHQRPADGYRLAFCLLSRLGD